MGTDAYYYMLRNQNKYKLLAPSFQKIFGVRLHQFWSNLTGFDIISMDEWLQPYEEEKYSMEEIIKERYGEDGAKLIWKLLE